MRGRSLLDVWRADRAAFEAYQELQATHQRVRFGRPGWASFIGTWDGRTMSVDLYEAGVPTLITEASIVPVSGVAFEAGVYDRYETRLSDRLASYAGRVHVEWGGGRRARQHVA